VSLRLDLRALLGAAIGVIVALATVALGQLSGGPTTLIVLVVLAIALVGLGLGAAASLYAYISASVVMILINAFPERPATSVPELIRIGAFVIGSPLVILLALRVERERAALLHARDAGAAVARNLEEEREHADAVRREADMAARHSEEDRARLAEVAEVMPEPLIVYDAEGRGTYANRAALRLFGRSFIERELAEWGNSSDPRDEQGTALARAEYPQVAAQTQTLRRRMLVRVPMSGRDLLIDVEGTPIPGGGAVLLLRDVGREEDERRRLSRFASFVAHELRNPLAVARARIELAQREADAPERSATHAVRALESVEAAIAVLERLEMYSRAESGMVEAVNEPFDVRRALNAAIERLRTRGSDRSVRVRVRGRPRTLGDPRLAEQAITNLLTNADRYSEANAPIQVRIEAGPDQVVMRVADGGPGIADEVAERLFKERMAAGRGLGLGLFLTDAMMTAQGGSVQLEQRRPQAVFVLRWMPAMERPGKRSHPTKREPGAAEAGDLAQGGAADGNGPRQDEFPEGKPVVEPEIGIGAAGRR
jgi:signal transduction histidine kinase